jgi:hypothetical protein
MDYPSLDALAEEFKPGEVLRVKAGSTTRLATVHGYVWAIPRYRGGPDVASLVVMTDTGIGCVYPDEVILRTKN